MAIVLVYGNVSCGGVGAWTCESWQRCCMERCVAVDDEKKKKKKEKKSESR